MSSSSTLDTALRERLGQNGFTTDQIDGIATAGVQSELVTTILDANLDQPDLQKVFFVVATLAAQLPANASFRIYPQEDDIPTIASYVRDLPIDDRNRVGDIYRSLSDDKYIFDMGRGYTQLRSIYADSVS